MLKLVSGKLSLIFFFCLFQQMFFKWLSLSLCFRMFLSFCNVCHFKVFKVSWYWFSFTLMLYALPPSPSLISVSNGGPAGQAGRCNPRPAESRRGLQRHPQPVRTSAQRANLSHRLQFPRFWIGHQPNSTNGKENFLVTNEILAYVFQSLSCRRSRTVTTGKRERNACVFSLCLSK